MENDKLIDGIRGSGRTRSPARVQTTNQITGNRRWIALAAVMLVMFFSALDQTVVATAMPVIIGDLQGFTLYAWVITAYMMASAVTVPVYGKLSDIYGRKPFYVLGLGLFMLGSIGAGMVQNMPELIGARVIQGLGAGALLTMPRATVGDIFNPRERGRWMGVISSIFGVASIIGPALGGWITDQWSWRWIFYINLPLAAIALFGIVMTLPTVRTEKTPKVDWMGSLALVLGLIPLLLAFTWAGSTYPWGSAVIIGLFVVSVVFLVLFFLAERRAEEPIMAPELFKNPLFTSTALVALFVAMGMFGSIGFLPLFIQGAQGLSAQSSGQILTPMMLSFIGGSIVGGQLVTRTGRYKLQILLAGLVGVFGMYLLTRLNANSPSWVVVVDMLVLGGGIGSVMPVLVVVVANAFPYRLMGMVDSTQQFVRSLGGIIALPVLGTVLTSTFTSEFSRSMPETLKLALNRLPRSEQGVLLDPQGLINAASQTAIKSQFTQLGQGGAVLYQQFIETLRNSLSTGVTHLFALGMVFMLLGVLAALFLPEIRLQLDEFFES
jgi:EmrB/QacA subfamily drug resistance transporter